MKKILLVLICILLLSGCKKNTIELSCEGKIREYDTKANIVYSVKKKNIKEAKAEYIKDLSDYSKEELENLKKKKVCDTLKDASITDCKVDYSNNKMILKVTFNVDDINKKDFDGKQVTFEVVKEKYEKEINGTCTEK